MPGQGQLVPLVLLPRYTTLAGQATSGQAFTTVAMDVTPYNIAYVTMWRGRVVGGATSPPFSLAFEESTDQVVWTTCSGSPSSGNYPGENEQKNWDIVLAKRWFRLRVQIADAGAVMSCYVIGNLMERVK